MKAGEPAFGRSDLRRNLTVTNKTPLRGNTPRFFFLHENGPHYVARESERISAMEIDTTENKRHEILRGSGGSGHTVGAFVP